MSDEALLLHRLQAATAHLVGTDQFLVAIPFDGCTETQQHQFGYFGNLGIAVLPADGAGRDWAAREYARAKELSAIPFQHIMGDDVFRRLVHKENPFDILLVPRALFGHESTLVSSVLEPAPSETPYALVVNYWRDARQHRRGAPRHHHPTRERRAPAPRPRGHRDAHRGAGQLRPTLGARHGGRYCC